MYYLKFVFIVTVLHYYLLFSSSSNDSHYTPKAKRGKWVNAMINVVSKTAYTAGNKAMQVAEWLINSTGDTPSREYARIQRLRSSNLRIKRSATKGRIIMSFLAMSAVAMQSAIGAHAEREVTFDTDSHAIGIDNRCSAYISPDPKDFIGKFQKTNRTITGFGGMRVRSIMKGTLRWHWEDDTGQVHQFDIPDSYYVPCSKQRLLSPQHLARILKSKRSPRGLVCENDADEAKLIWNNGRNARTVPISEYDNCFTFRLAPGFKYFMAYCAEFGLDTLTNNTKSLLADATLIEDDEDEMSQSSAPEP
jgi:hypothetical protein